LRVRENNVPALPPQATERTGITPMLVRKVSNGMEGADRREVFIPIACVQCENRTPCVSVCPQQAVEVDRATGIVMQMPQRCLGCRYCMTACPYHARYFNWWDPAWPTGMEKSLNPGVSVRMRGVVEKCNLCHASLRRSLSDEGHSVWRPGRRKRPSLPGLPLTGGVSIAGAAGNGAKDLLQIQAALGAGAC
jgi:molybdopterin-containing oxidoreductase family iron-sulfur binding subunit